ARFVVAANQTASAGNYAGIARPEQGRALVTGRKIGKLTDDGCARIMNGKPRGRGMGRAASDAGIRQIRCSGSELDALEIQSETAGCDLRQRRPGPLSHVVRTRLHDAASVRAHHRTRGGLEHQGRECSRTHAPANQETSVIAHLPRRGWTSSPAEAFAAA